MGSADTTTCPAPVPSAAKPHPIAAQIQEPKLHLPGDVDVSTWDPATAVRFKSGTCNITPQWTLNKTFTLSTLEAYFRTFSALHTYHEEHPEDLANKGKGEAGDIVDRLMRKIAAGLRNRKKDAGELAPRNDVNGESETIEVAWPLVLMMIQKRA
jgi:hypothetical protein